MLLVDRRFFCIGYELAVALASDLGHPGGDRPEPGIPEKDVIGYGHGTKNVVLAVYPPERRYYFIESRVICSLGRETGVYLSSGI